MLGAGNNGITLVGKDVRKGFIMDEVVLVGERLVMVVCDFTEVVILPCETPDELSLTNVVATFILEPDKNMILEENCFRT